MLAITVGFLASVAALGAADQAQAPAGLCVQIGYDDAGDAIRLARTGRCLVQMLTTDAAASEKLKKQIEAAKFYGLVTVVRIESADRLPYAENLVNRIDLRSGKPNDEATRVLCPGGLVFSGGKQVFQKPWPPEMGDWSHPLQGADGNTVSSDRAVGPPRRVRWVTGPEMEISSMVSAGGRVFYGGVWARDAFNGLRLWEKQIKPSPAQGGFGYGKSTGSVRPVASPDRLFIGNDHICALRAADGSELKAYPEAGKPNTILLVGDSILAVGDKEIRCVAVESGKLLWRHAAENPRMAAATDRNLFFIAGSLKPLKAAAVCLDVKTGKAVWKTDSLEWLPKVQRIVAHGDLIVFEVSTLADEKKGNAIHMASAADCKILWSHEYVPGMSHRKQARAMFIGDSLWVLEDKKSVELDSRTGSLRKECTAGNCHCFPPVATPNYMLCGEMDLVELATGRLDKHQITKAQCGRDGGWVPANGLIYAAPKHCVCWPMLRGFVAMAPELPSDNVADVIAKQDFQPEQGEKAPATAATAAAESADWPCYRHDAWRSGATQAELPGELSLLWTAELGDWPEGNMVQDWRENPFVRGPITAPVVAAGRVFAARPDAHQVVALDAKSGRPVWQFIADGRVDTPPTIHAGLCLFGTRSGSVYCLGAETGKLIWRLRAAPSDRQIVAHGQVESPWPVPGSVLVVDDTAYFAAGRQPLADEGILVFAAEPKTGKVKWVERINSLPMTNFYACVGLEFDNFDLMFREGDRVAMSRWLFDRESGKKIVKAGEAFVKMTDGDWNLVAPRGTWTYAPRHQVRIDKLEQLPRPLTVYRRNTLFGSTPDQRSVYRRDFTREDVEKFESKWITGWAAGQNRSKKTGDVWTADRTSKGAAWSNALYSKSDPDQRIGAMVLAGDRLITVGVAGGIQAISLDNGKPTAKFDSPAPIWDGIAVADGRLWMSTADGRILCFGKQ